MPLAQWADWIDYGEFDEHGRWHFNKEAIRQELERKAQRARYCPVFKSRDLEASLDKIPDVVNPENDPDWAYRTTTQDDGQGGYEKVAIGIRPDLERASKYVVRDYEPAVNWEDEQGYSETITVNLQADSGIDDSSRKTRNRKMKSQNSGCAGVILLLVTTGSLLLLA